MKRILVLALTVSFFTISCGDPVPPATPTPVQPTITENFAGTLLALGSNQHPFTIQQVGGLVVTIGDITPKTTIGFAVGAPGLSGCTALRNATAVDGETTTLTLVATLAGVFCVAVVDVGGVVDP